MALRARLLSLQKLHYTGRGAYRVAHGEPAGEAHQIESEHCHGRSFMLRSLIMTFDATPSGLGTECRSRCTRLPRDMETRRATMPQG